MSKEAHDFLMSSGGRSVSFEKVGDKVLGIVLSYERTQQTDFKTKKPLTWDNGDPKLQLVITLQTDEQVDDDDDGLRKLYCKSPVMRKAIADAVRAKKWTDSIVGGRLYVKFISTKPSQTRGLNDVKLYSAAFEPPTRTTGDLELEPEAVADAGTGHSIPPDDDIPF